MFTRRVLGLFKYRVKKIIPAAIWTFISGFVAKRKSVQFNEYQIKGREFKPQTAFVIRRRPPGGGLFSNVNHVLQGLEKANEENWIPFVDMENYWTNYSQRKSFASSHNAWEYFFEPVSNEKISDAMNYAKVVYSKGDRINPDAFLADKSLSFVFNPENIKYLNELYSHYIRLNSTSKKILEDVKDFIGWDSDSLGISFRGTDYLTLKPSGHARQPGLEKLESKALEIINKNQISKSLIATEDLTARKLLSKNQFLNPYRNFRDFNIFEKFLPRGRVSKNVKIAMSYLVEIYLLSECKSLTTTVANGSATAIIINGNKYEELYIFDIGTY